MPQQCELHSSQIPRQVKLPRHNLRAAARSLLNLSRPGTEPKGPDNSSNNADIDARLTVVCLADTHNLQPIIPGGDILIHAGDLSEWGSFDEIQTQLTWLASHPHKYKIVVAGNHDVLFDSKFLASHQDTYPVQPRKTARDLDFHDLIYLENSTVELEFPDRKLKIWGSPMTPRYGDSAFQYPREEDVWEKVDWTGVDVLVTHGPLWGHLDGVRRAGCRFLGEKVSRSKGLKLHVCGHIHAGAGKEVVWFDGVRRAFEGVESGSSGWDAIPGMLFRVIFMRLGLWLGIKDGGRGIQLVNAAIKRENGASREPVVVYV